MLLVGAAALVIVIAAVLIWVAMTWNNKRSE